MQTEFEAKFCQVDHNRIRQALKGAGADLVTPMRTMRRVVIESDFMKDDKDAFVRIRDEGDKTTITYKRFDNLSVEGAKEIEVEVSDFDKAVSIFAESGLGHRSFQESKRETWNLDGCAIELDEWPWLDPYIEIEGDSVEAVQAVAEKLGFKWSEAVFGDVMAAYRVQYPHLDKDTTVGSLKIVRFGDPVPDMLEQLPQ